MGIGLTVVQNDLQGIVSYAKGVSIGLINWLLLLLVIDFSLIPSMLLTLEYVEGILLRLLRSNII
ncbi:hypothetical protein [Colwellia hornerae]|uniref:Uncharacterized protein n=2 Tax=Colwellia hornerae TaxID=89402 RepID=A0A5C6Q804_9GAMM|nr:hypothetical protein [Colwellia hornerae]TWX52227.1 hypothetical protein ESZ28_13415 [Colwellia hornerae]TWX57576.1 hypothetical protein ESZ26_13380 [Colwellia hornerae]TWX64928.1 hypothetical protein ESZ27_13695 [Colwellia hornerae]